MSAGKNLVLADNSKSDYSIIIPSNPTEYELKAATELQNYFKRVTACVLKISKDNEKAGNKAFLIGRAAERELSPGVPLYHQLENDEILIQTIQDRVILKGGGKKGTLYAVYEFLEAFVGCRFYTKDYEYVPVQKTLVMDAIDYRYRPPIAWRVPYFTYSLDPTFIDKRKSHWHDLNNNDDIEWGSGFFAHTMFKLVEPQKYQEDHPEYFTKNKRRPRRIQLCLSNPDVLKLTIENLKKKIDKYPNATHWSVSQADNNNYCRCPDCRKIDEHEESPSGSIINFVNKVAQAFPDKTISTLAYRHSSKPPKYLVPASNVNIMVCAMGFDRSRPIVDSVSGKKFVDDLAGWSKISQNIFVWDYLIQFTNLMAPFPNFHVIQPNIQLLTKYNVKGSLQQGWYRGYSEFSELRTYLIARLLWNPDYNSDEVIDDFMDGYYGMAGQFLRAYIDEMKQNLLNSDEVLLHNGSPAKQINSFLSKEHMARYNYLFDTAEKAVGDDTLLLSRVKIARLPLTYAGIEIAKISFIGNQGFLEKDVYGWSIKQNLVKKINHFVAASDRAGVSHLSEFRNRTPQNFRKRSLASFMRVKTIFNAIELCILLSICLYFILYIDKKVLPVQPSVSDWRKIFKGELINIVVILIVSLCFSFLCHYHHYLAPRLYTPLLFYGKALVSKETFALIYFVLFYIALSLLFWVTYFVIRNRSDKGRHG